MSEGLLFRWAVSGRDVHREIIRAGPQQNPGTCEGATIQQIVIFNALHEEGTVKGPCACLFDIIDQHILCRARSSSGVTIVRCW